MRNITSCGYQQCFLVLNCLTWALQAWPVRLNDENCSRITDAYLTLESNEGVNWEFLFSPKDFEVIPFKVEWDSDDGIRLKVTSSPVSLIEDVLLNRPKSLVFNTLFSLAEYLQVSDCGKLKTRVALLKAIVKSLPLAADDSDRMLELVLAKESESKSQEDMTDTSAEMVECLLENLDLSEKQDFSSLREKADSRSHVKKAKKWMNWYKEKLDEIEVPLVLKVSHFGFPFKPDLVLIYGYDDVLWVQSSM